MISDAPPVSARLSVLGHLQAYSETFEKQEEEDEEEEEEEEEDHVNYICSFLADRSCHSNTND